MEVTTASGTQVVWAAGIPVTNSGDLEMVTAWKKLGFILGQADGSYVLVESNWHNYLKESLLVSYKPEIGSLVGLWTYRSFLADPDLATAFNDLEFGRGNIKVDEAPFGVFRGRIYDTGWALELNGSIQYGTPFQVRFQGKGIVGGEEWIYDYLGYVVAPGPTA